MKDWALGGRRIPSADRLFANSNGSGHDNHRLALNLLLDRTAFARERDSSLRLQNDIVGASA
jgi:hypothetical protein